MPRCAAAATQPASAAATAGRVVHAARARPRTTARRRGTAPAPLRIGRGATTPPPERAINFESQPARRPRRRCAGRAEASLTAAAGPQYGPRPMPVLEPEGGVGPVRRAGARGGASFRIATIAGLIVAVAGVAAAANPFATRQRIVYSDGLHNENTEMIRLGRRILLAFRGGETGQVG